MKKLFYLIFYPAILFISASCIQTGDEERTGMAVASDLLLTKVWEVDLFRDGNQDNSHLFHNVFLEFRPNQVFNITHNCDIISGKWILSQDSTLLVIRIPDSTEPFSQFEDEWVITWLTETEMRLVEQDYKGDDEFTLKVTPLQSLNCTSCLELSHELVENLWSITEFKTIDQEFTDASRGAYLEFNLNGEVKLYSGDDEITGSWVLTAQCNTLVIKWYDTNIHTDHYNALQDYWYIHNIYSNTISLESEEGTLEVTKGKIPDCVELHSHMSNTSWSIDFVSINGDNVSENFLGTGLTFLENNQLATDVIVGPAVLGNWLLSGNCDILAIQIQTGQLKELSKEWIITEIKPEQIYMLYEEGTLSMEMVLKRGKPYPTPNCLESVGKISDARWSLEKFSENGYKDADYLYGYYLKFTDEGALVISNDDQEIMGTWYPVMDCKYMVIELDREGPAGKLDGKWKIQTLESNKFVMVYEKMGLKRTIEMVSS